MLNLTYEYDDRRLLDLVTNTVEGAPENNFNLDYGYDSFGRVSSATGAATNGDWSLQNSYQFDKGTRLEYSVISGIPRVTEFLPETSAPHIVHLYDEAGVESETKTYGYNNVGELWRMTSAVFGRIENEVHEFQFNSDGTLAGVTTPDADVSFKYDEMGNRVYKKSVSTSNVVNETFYLFNLFSMKNGVIHRLVLKPSPFNDENRLKPAVPASQRSVSRGMSSFCVAG
jgi:YD repeat-containing protein